MRILLLASCYPPQPVVGAFRVEKLARAFARNRHEVFVVAIEDGQPRTPPHIDGVTVKIVPRHRNPREVIIELRDRLRKMTSSSVGSRNSDSVQKSVELIERGWTSRLVLGALNLPDAEQGVVPALLRGVREMEDQGPFDLVYSTCPPFSTQIAAMMAAKRLRTPWVSEYRDPWRSNGTSRIARIHPWTDRADAWLAQRCMKRAAMVVAVTQSAAEEFHSIRGDDNVICALNGIQRLHTTRVPRAGQTRLRIAYAGSLYPPRDPRPILESIITVSAKSGLPIPEVVFVGDQEYEGESLEAFARRTGFGQHLIAKPWLPQGEVEQLLSSADLLLLPAQGWLRQLPNKLFDYLGVRVPVLCLADRSSEPARLLERVGGHFVCTSLDQLDEVVQEALRCAPVAGVVGDTSVLESLLVDRQFGELVRLVEQRFH